MATESMTVRVFAFLTTNSLCRPSPNSTLNSEITQGARTNSASCAPDALSTTTTALNIGHKIGFIFIGANFGHIFEVPTHSGGDYFEGVFALVFRPCDNLVGVD